MNIKSFLEKMGTIFKWVGFGLLLLLVILVISALVLMAIDKIFPQGWNLDAQLFVILVSIILSIAWSFIPKLRVKFGELEASIKAIVNLILMIILAGLMFLFTCTNWNPIPGVVCNVQGAKELGLLVFYAVAGNYITYGMTAPPDDVKAAKASRGAG